MAQLALHTVNRDPIRERDLTDAAARPYGVSGDRLNTLADMRAVDGPVRTDGRDLIREALEEAADGRNYAVWEMMRLANETPDRDDLAIGRAHESLGLALGAFAAAFHHLRQARDELRP